MDMINAASRHRYLPLFLAFAVACFCVGQSTAAVPAPQAKGGNPSDLLGVWIGAGFGSTAWRNTSWTLTPEFTAWGAAESKRMGDPQVSIESYCEPPGPTVLMGANPLFPMQIAMSPGELVIMMEGAPIPRHIYIDGRTHPDFVELGWTGHSVGHWEGDVLVVDTIGLKAPKRPLNGFASNAVIPLPTDKGPRLPISEQLHMIERIRLVGGGQFLENEITLIDPKAYAKPLTAKFYSQRRPDLTLLDLFCNEDTRPQDEGYVPVKATEKQ
jgi:hypothetical protein